MSGTGLPSNVKKQLETACNNAMEEISKIAPGEKNKQKLEKLLNDKICKNVDKKILTEVAKQLAAQGKKNSAKAPANTPPKVSGVPKMQDPAKGAPSLTIPLSPKIKLGDWGQAKFEAKFWGDPKSFGDPKSNKGGMVFFKVKF